MNLKKAIKKAKKGDQVAQRFLYDRFKMALYNISLRYGRDHSEAKDILQEGFINIFKDLHQFADKGNLEGWMRRVMVNTALRYLRKWKKDWQHEDSQEYEEAFHSQEVVFQKLGMEELTRLIQRLPVGYKIVFNLFVIEGYSHKEIANLLGVSTNTTKTQLFKAKAALRKQLEKELLTQKSNEKKK